MRLMQFTVAVALCSLTLHVPSVWADNDTCENSEYLFPGEAAEFFVPGSLNRFFKTAVVAGRSYSIAAWAPFSDPSEVTGGPSLTISLSSTCQTSIALGDHVGEPDTDVITHNGDRATITPGFTGTLWIAVGNVTVDSYFVHARIIETTLFSPWWFVGGTNQAFAEIRNNTNASINLTATFFASDGTVCGASSVNLPANGNTAIGVKFLGTCAIVVSGSAQIAFQGAPGGVVANITTIDGVQATSFDSPFTPRMEWGAFTR